MLRLILVRHGEPAAEVQGRCYGTLDVGLSEAGRRQLRRKMSLLGSLAPDLLYTSTARRAVESADEISRELNLQPQSVTDLCEINFGDFEGLYYSEIEERYPQEYKQWMEDPTSLRFPGGEGFTELQNRVLAFVSSLVRVHAGCTVLAVSHAGVNRAILADALGLLSKNVFRIDQAYACVNVIDYFPKFALARLING